MLASDLKRARKYGQTARRSGAEAMRKRARMASRRMDRAFSSYQTPSGSFVNTLSYGKPTGEVKGVDSDISQSLIATTTTNSGIDVLNLIVPGSGSWNRIGRKTILKSVKISGSIAITNTPTFATGVGRSGVVIRCCLVWDAQPVSTIPIFSAIFGSTLQAGTEQVTSIFDPIKYDGMERFRMIRDWRITNPPTTPVSQGTGPSTVDVIPVNEYVKLPRLQSNYSGQTDPQTIADIASGALYLIWRVDSTSSAVASVLTGMARLRYYD